MNGMNHNLFKLDNMTWIKLAINCPMKLPYSMALIIHFISCTALQSNESNKSYIIQIAEMIE